MLYLDINISAILSPVVVIDKEEHKHSEGFNSTLFATPPSIKTRDADVQTFIKSPSPSPPPPPPPMPIQEEEGEEEEKIIEPSLPPYIDLIFSHMNEVNQWINQFCADNESIENDINIIRVRLKKIFLGKKIHVRNF